MAMRTSPGVSNAGGSGRADCGVEELAFNPQSTIRIPQFIVPPATLCGTDFTVCVHTCSHCFRGKTHGMLRKQQQAISKLHAYE